MGIFREFFQHNSDGQITKAGYAPDIEVPQDVIDLHSALEKMNQGEAEEPLDFAAPSMSFDLTPTEVDEQDGEHRERLGTVAKNVIDCFDFNPDKESFLVVTDDKVIRENGGFIEAIRQELAARTSANQRTKGNFEIIIVPASPRSATPFGQEIGDKLKDRPVLIATSMSRSHSREVGSALRREIAPKENYEAILQSPKLRELAEKGFSTHPVEFLDGVAATGLSDEYYDKMRAYIARQKGIRLISITKGHNPFEILTRGAVEESVEVLRERAERVDGLMKDVEEVHITSPLGTNLVLHPRYDKSEIEDGRIDKPGKLANYPIGEWSCSPFQEGANGILVVDGPIGGNHNLDMVKKYGPLRITIKDGKMTQINDLELTDIISKIDGGSTTGNPLIDSVVKYLHDGGNDEHAFRLAELGVGTNGRACEGKPDEWVGSSEGEKVYGSIHIAFGSNGTFGIDKQDPNFNNCNIHCDNVVGIQTPITVECTKKDQTKFKLIDNGKPIGY